jgi:hypothetical protein
MGSRTHPIIGICVTDWKGMISTHSLTGKFVAKGYNVFGFITEYSSFRDFGPYLIINRSIFM